MKPRRLRADVLHTPHAFFHRAALCPSMASGRRAILSTVSPLSCAHLQQGADHFVKKVPPC
ncbi:MAG TPA: hypothetical protein VN361_00985 [Oxalicibacterium sp.]|nr:hypothetical protein [Oxalicibacterium sp.]